eukprot:CAMPEP_0202892214 /NCGR_PEP_ID=MMETSP1392-20130828/1990_1 /ASSEMBLY_ACC=CAM_ASM_000868 /TAXON_ID=225041 /ORGANISM="Chlamydomonas chlamydogama, Strain SAG 11-48b" /LENGTH=419 /DNA_ID=CAMNT_0049576103 /DNA_START=174 /DNA_END=1429 /DNA_ORIENTATION=-
MSTPRLSGTYAASVGKKDSKNTENPRSSRTTGSYAALHFTTPQARPRKGSEPGIGPGSPRSTSREAKTVSSVAPTNDNDGFSHSATAQAPPASGRFGGTYAQVVASKLQAAQALMTPVQKSGQVTVADNPLFNDTPAPFSRQQSSRDAASTADTDDCIVNIDANPKLSSSKHEDDLHDHAGFHSFRDGHNPDATRRQLAKEKERNRLLSAELAQCKAKLDRTDKAMKAALISEDRVQTAHWDALRMYNQLEEELLALKQAERQALTQLSAAQATAKQLSQVNENQVSLTAAYTDALDAAFHEYDDVTSVDAALPLIGNSPGTPGGGETSTQAAAYSPSTSSPGNYGLQCSREQFLQQQLSLRDHIVANLAMQWKNMKQLQRKSDQTRAALLSKLLMFTEMSSEQCASKSQRDAEQQEGA